MRNFLIKLLTGHTKAELTMGEYAANNPDLVVIVLNPKDDSIFVGFRNKVVYSKIKNATGKKQRVIRGLLWQSQFQNSMDGVIVSLIDVFKVPLRLPQFNQVAQALDGALFNISKSLRKKTAPDAGPKGAVKSPYVGAGFSGRPQD
jgi:hypothetical protein